VNRITFLIYFSLLMQSCGTLDDKTILINPGDSRERVLEIMGTPQDRQFDSINEAWQYCVSGAGFGYNDHKIIWFAEGSVIGLSTYRTSVTGCSGGIRSIVWEEAPDFVLESRER